MRWILSGRVLLTDSARLNEISDVENQARRSLGSKSFLEACLASLGVRADELFW